jgi:hypothetical protein
VKQVVAAEQSNTSGFITGDATPAAEEAPPRPFPAQTTKLVSDEAAEGIATTAVVPRTPDCDDICTADEDTPDTGSAAAAIPTVRSSEYRRRYGAVGLMTHPFTAFLSSIETPTTTTSTTTCLPHIDSITVLISCE